MDKRKIFPIFLIVFANIMGAGMILPVLPLFAEQTYGATAQQAIYLAAIFYAAQFVGAPILGAISDRVGRRPVLLISQVGTVLSYILLIFAGTLGAMVDSWGLGIAVAGGLVIFYVARILDGATFGNITTAQSYITDVTPVQQRAQALGMLGAAFGLGFIIGPGLGGILAGIDPIAPFIGAAVLTGVSLILTTFILPESLPVEKRARQLPASEQTSLSELLGHRSLIIIFMVAFSITIVFASMQSTFVLYASRVAFSGESDPQTIALKVGGILAFVGVVSVIAQGGLIRPLVNRFGERKVILMGQGFLLLAFFLLANASNALQVTLATAPLALGTGLINPSLQSLVTRYGTPSTQGRLLGIYQSINSIALIAGPLLGGFLFAQYGATAPYLYSVPVVAISLLLSILLLRESIPSNQRFEPADEIVPDVAAFVAEAQAVPLD